MLTNHDRRKFRTRNRIAKSNKSLRPRASVHRSNTNIYIQLFDHSGKVLYSFSTLNFKGSPKISGLEKAKSVGKEFAELCLKGGITKIVFDKGAYVYGGRVKALAESCRAAGLQFLKNLQMSKQQAKNQKEKTTEIVEKLVSINRVSKTVKGGKNMSFSALVVVGDANGRVGFGKGNATEVADAKSKAFEAAKKAMIKVALKEGRTIHHDIFARFCSGKVYLRSAPAGTGVIAGGPMRAIFECAGIHDIVAKSVGTSNPYNMVGATFAALKQLLSPRLIAERRSKEISEIIKRRNSALKYVEPKQEQKTE